MSKKARAGVIIIDQERCKGCELCLDICPHNLIEKTDSLNSRGYSPVAYKDGVFCPGKRCILCALVCPEVAIDILKKDGQSKVKSDLSKTPQGGKK